MKKEIREEFKRKLYALLEEYDANISAYEHWKGYGECGQDVSMTVEFKDLEIEDIELGTWVDKTGNGAE